MTVQTTPYSLRQQLKGFRACAAASSIAHFDSAADTLVLQIVSQVTKDDANQTRTIPNRIDGHRGIHKSLPDHYARINKTVRVLRQEPALTHRAEDPMPPARFESLE